MEIFLNGSCGLGDYLCTISLLTSVPEPIVAYVNNDDGAYDQLTQLTKLLCIPERQLKIVYKEGAGNFGGNWHLNVLGNYYRATSVNVNGRTLPLNKKKTGRYIGFACYNGVYEHIDSNNNLIRYPNHVEPATYPLALRYRSLPYYAKLFEIVRSWGYDIMTFDHPFGLDLKVENLVENCEAVIGYEGGMGHLCSVLGIPYLMYDWRTGNINKPYGKFQVETIHQSSTVFMLPNDEFLLNCSRDEFEHIIYQLNKRKTNNRIVNKSVNIAFTQGANSNIEFVDRHGTVLHKSTEQPWITQPAADFMHHFFPHRFPNLLKL